MTHHGASSERRNDSAADRDDLADGRDVAATGRDTTAHLRDVQADDRDERAGRNADDLHDRLTRIERQLLGRLRAGEHRRRPGRLAELTEAGLARLRAHAAEQDASPPSTGPPSATCSTTSAPRSATAASTASTQPGTAAPPATTDRLPPGTAPTPRTTATSRPATATRPTSSGSSPTGADPTDATPVADRPDGRTTRCPSRWRGRSGIPGGASPTAAPTSPAEVTARLTRRRPTDPSCYRIAAMTQPPIPATTMPVSTFRAWLVPGCGDVEEPDADARVHRQAELGDRETRAGAHPRHQGEQGEVADAEQDAGAELRARGTHAQLDRLAGRQSQGEGTTQDPQREREVAHLRRNRGPLSRHEVAPPQNPGRPRPQEPGPRRGRPAGTGAARSGRPGNPRSAVRRPRR